jgi:hypothetical protein
MTLSVPRVGGHRGKTHSGPFARVVENSYRYLYLTLRSEAHSAKQINVHHKFGVECPAVLNKGVILCL